MRCRVDLPVPTQPALGLVSQTRTRRAITSKLQGRCETVRVSFIIQVQRLQQQLGNVHSADYNTLKRAYVSLVQHFRALQIEAQVWVLSCSRLFLLSCKCAASRHPHVKRSAGR